MAEALVDHAGTWYLAALIGGFAAVAWWETVRPLRPLSVPLAPRWLTNLGLQAINQVVLVAALPLMALAAAAEAQARGWGLLAATTLPFGVKLVLGLLALDAVRWALHAACHRLPWLWRLHRVHHSDLDYDCTIGLRFHPLEALLSQGVLILAVVLLGVPPVVVLVSDVLTIAHGFVAHGNVSLPPGLDARLRRWVVTPDLHRVHHSVRVEESQSNFGSVLALWDRAFATWRAAPADGPLGMAIGLGELRDARQLTLARLLWLPFRA